VRKKKKSSYVFPFVHHDEGCVCSVFLSAYPTIPRPTIGYSNPKKGDLFCVAWRSSHSVWLVSLFPLALRDCVPGRHVVIRTPSCQLARLPPSFSLLPRLPMPPFFLSFFLFFLSLSRHGKIRLYIISVGAELYNTISSKRIHCSPQSPLSYYMERARTPPTRRVTPFKIIPIWFWPTVPFR